MNGLSYRPQWCRLDSRSSDAGNKWFRLNGETPLSPILPISEEKTSLNGGGINTTELSKKNGLYSIKDKDTQIREMDGMKMLIEDIDALDMTAKTSQSFSMESSAMTSNASLDDETSIARKIDTSARILIESIESFSKKRIESPKNKNIKSINPNNVNASSADETRNETKDTKQKSKMPIKNVQFRVEAAKIRRNKKIHTPNHAEQRRLRIKEKSQAQATKDKDQNWRLTRSPMHKQKKDKKRVNLETATTVKKATSRSNKSIDLKNPMHELKKIGDKKKANEAAATTIKKAPSCSNKSMDSKIFHRLYGLSKPMQEAGKKRREDIAKSRDRALTNKYDTSRLIPLAGQKRRTHKNRTHRPWQPVAKKQRIS